MKPALIILGFLIIVGIVLKIHDKLTHTTSGNDTPADNEPVVPTGCDDSCCAAHEVCPSQLLLEAEMKCEVEYYDDYELDEFKGRASSDYTEEELEQFRDVLYTLRRDDLLGWERSLKKRGIALPTPIRDELISLYSA